MLSDEMMLLFLVSFPACISSLPSSFFLSLSHSSLSPSISLSSSSLSKCLMVTCVHLAPKVFLPLKGTPSVADVCGSQGKKKSHARPTFCKLFCA